VKPFKYSFVWVAAAVVLGTAVGSMGAKKAPPTSIEAIVVKLDGTNLIVQAADDRHFKKLEVPIGSQTVVMLEFKPGTLADLRAGERVIISPPGGTATKIEEKAAKTARISDVGLTEGFVVKVSGTDLVIRGASSKGEIVDMKVPTDSTTVVLISGKTSKLTDLTTGQSVLVVMSGGFARRIAVQATDQT
jgi:hypothetical protein